MSEHECVDCRALPPEPYHADGTPDGWRRPRTPRPIDPRSGPRSKRCATHYRAKLAREKAARHDAYVAKVYGLSPGDYRKLYEAQGGRCAIRGCAATGKVKKLAVEHDHDPVVPCPAPHPRNQACRHCVRGLVCGPHNYDLLGKFKNSLQPALDYLADPPAQRILNG